LTAPAAALAHASLVGTTPASGAVLDRSPGRVVLRFDEPVATVAGSIRVFDSQVERVDSGAVEKPTSNSVSASIPEDLGQGTYVVAWRVLSADSHPIRGAFAFSIGEPVASSEDIVREVLDREADSQAVDTGLAVVRFLGLALILLSVGGAFVLGYVADPAALQGRWHWPVLAIVGLLLALDSAAWIALTGVKAAGFGLGEIFTWSLSRDILDTDFGKVWVLRGGVARAQTRGGRGASRRRSAPDVALLFLGSAIAVTPALSGHARIEGTLGILSDVIHVLAAGIWAGGLAFLALLLVEAGGDRWSLAGTIVPRFSTVAVVAVGALIAAGLASGYLEVRSVEGIWSTTYGRLLLAKVVLLLPLLALGAFNNRVSVPRLRAGASDTASRRAFARAVTSELLILLTVVGVTAALVAEPPAKAQAAGASGPVSREGRVGPYDYTLTVDPARVGSNAVHVYLLDSSGQLAAVDELTLAGTLPAVDVGPLELELSPAGPGHATGVAQLPLPGDWQLDLHARMGEFDEWSTVIDVPIGKD
jgi:copper transport protein